MATHQLEQQESSPKDVPRSVAAWTYTHTVDLQSCSVSLQLLTGRHITEDSADFKAARVRFRFHLLVGCAWITKDRAHRLQTVGAGAGQWLDQAAMLRCSLSHV